MDNILTILHENPRLSNAQIAAMTNLSEDEVGERIAFYEKSGQEGIHDLFEYGSPETAKTTW